MGSSHPQVVLYSLALTLSLLTQLSQLLAFEHFEARMTHPLAYSAERAELYAVYPGSATLAIFEVGSTREHVPVRVAEIPVGLESVSVRVMTPNEAWVVNELSDSVTVIDLDRREVVATLSVLDEPSDIVRAGEMAFVSCAQAQCVQVIALGTREVVRTIPLRGIRPSTLAVAPDESRVYVSFLYSGNNTTVVPPSAADPQPAPDNPALPDPPVTAEIVADSDPRLSYEVIDHDVAVIDVATLTVLNYYSDIGTNLFATASDSQGRLWIGNSEAHNLIRYEPALRGLFASSRLSMISPDGEPVIYDLNAPINTVTVSAEVKDTALSQPMSIVIEPDGRHAWIGAFASDRVARVRDDGEVILRVDLRKPKDDSRQMRGPRGLIFDPDRERLYVYHKLSGTLATIDLASEEPRILSEIPLGATNPMPKPIREGRGFLFDARLSGNGLTACGTCHIDADHDGMAWDLGDPTADLQVVMGADLAIHDETPRERLLHPMKGPMVTQTLRGVRDQAPFHWRGDRPTISHFNPTYHRLMGGDEIADDAMADLTTYLESLSHHPNPNRTLERGLKTDVDGGDATLGRLLFLPHLHHCSICHLLPDGSDHNVDDHRLVRAEQPVKTAPLRLVYQKRHFTPKEGETLSGFGMNHDGTGFSLPRGHFYELDQLSGREFQDLTAFLLSFDTGTAPAAGHAVTLAPTASDPDDSTLALLESQAQAGGIDLIVRGQGHHYHFDPESGVYHDPHSEQDGRTRAELVNALRQEEATLTWMGVPPDMQHAFLSPRTTIAPAATIRRDASGVWLEPMSSDESHLPHWYWQHAADLRGPWRTWAPLRSRVPLSESSGQGYFRLRAIFPTPFN